MTPKYFVILKNTQDYFHTLDEVLVFLKENKIINTKQFRKHKRDIGTIHQQLENYGKIFIMSNMGKPNFTSAHIYLAPWTLPHIE